MQPSEHPDLLVGLDTGDDALVWRRPNSRALVATVDFFAPVVDDPRTFGRVAAANAVSDIYAMGAEPLFALAVAGWPDSLPPEALADVLDGGVEMAREHGWVVAGGHTVEAPEPFYGQAVIGEVDVDAVITNANGRAGDRLYLTKPIGTGLALTAGKRVGRADPQRPVVDAVLAESVRQMETVNRAAGRAAVDAGVRCGTDVTGFGLLGHLHKLAMASSLAAHIDWNSVPLLPGVEALAGYQAGAVGRNLDFVGPGFDLGGLDPTESELARVLMADPQTSGGLLLAIGPAGAERLEALAADGSVSMWPIGELRTGRPGSVVLK